jgi:DNA-binding response OmpR family regulator
MARVLVVDDHRDTTDSLCMLLAAHGHTVHACYSAADCERALETFAAHLAIVDLWMPGTNGFELARRLKPLGLPIIVLTGDGSPLGDDAELFALRLLKPPLILDLLHAVEAVYRLAVDGKPA